LVIPEVEHDAITEIGNADEGSVLVSLLECLRLDEADRVLHGLRADRLSMLSKEKRSQMRLEAAGANRGAYGAATLVDKRSERGPAIVKELD
jgi:hypothetical protein